MALQGKKIANKVKAQILADFCARLQGGMTQENAAHLSGVHWVTLNNWINEVVAAGCIECVDPRDGDDGIKAAWLGVPRYKKEIKWGYDSTPDFFEDLLITVNRLSRQDLCIADASLHTFGKHAPVGVRRMARILIDNAFCQHGRVS